MPRPGAHHGVVLRLVRGKGERSGEAVSGYPRGLGSQKEKGRQEALLLCLAGGLPPGSCSCGAPQGSVSPAPADSSWGTMLTGGMWWMRVCGSRGIACAEGFPTSRRGEQEEGSPDHCHLGHCLFLGSLCPKMRSEKKWEKKELDIFVVVFLLLVWQRGGKGVI